MTISEYPLDDAASPLAVDRQVFVAGGTWTKPTGGQTVTRVELVAGGGGGGGGGSGATGGTRQGGAGGAGGAYVEAFYRTADLPSTVSVIVGTGGTGGIGAGITGVLTPTPGATGATGGSTTFGSYLRAYSQVTAARGSAGGRTGIFDTATTGQTVVGPGAGAGNNGGTGNASHGGGFHHQPGGGGQGGGGASTNAIQGQRGDGINNMAMDDWGNVAKGGLGTGVSQADNATDPPSSIKQIATFAYGLIPYYSGAGGSMGPLGITGPATGPGGNGSDAFGYGAGGGGGGAGTLGTGGIGGRGAPGIAIITSY